MFGSNTPIWILEPALVHMRKHVQDKYDPFVEEMDLLYAYKNYAVVQLPKGREATISARDTASIELCNIVLKQG